MTNIIKVQNRLKSVPDEILVKEIQRPTGQAPQFLVLNELNRRKNDRAEYARLQQEGPQTTVAEDIARPAAPPVRPPMGQAGPAMPPPQAMGAPQAMPPQHPMPQQPPMRPQPVQMNEGGLTSLPKFDVGGLNDMRAELSHLNTKWQKTPAELARQGMLTEMLASRGNVMTREEPDFASGNVMTRKGPSPVTSEPVAKSWAERMLSSIRGRRPVVARLDLPPSNLPVAEVKRAGTFMPELRQIRKPASGAFTTAHDIPTGVVNKDAAATNYANRVLSDVGRYNKDVRVHGRSTPFLPIEGGQPSVEVAEDRGGGGGGLPLDRRVEWYARHGNTQQRRLALAQLGKGQPLGVKTPPLTRTHPSQVPQLFRDRLAGLGSVSGLEGGTFDPEAFIASQNIAADAGDADTRAAALEAQTAREFDRRVVTPKTVDALSAELEVAQAKANKRIPPAKLPLRSVLQSNAVQKAVAENANAPGGTLGAGSNVTSNVVPASFSGNNDVRVTSAAFTESPASNGNGQVSGEIVDAADRGPDAETFKVSPIPIPSSVELQTDALLKEIKNLEGKAPTLNADTKITDLQNRAAKIDEERGSTAARRIFEAGLNIMAEAGKPGASFGGTIPSILRAVGTGAAPAVSAYGKDVAALEARKDALQSKIVDAQLRGDANAIQQHTNSLKAITDRIGLLQAQQRLGLDERKVTETERAGKETTKYRQNEIGLRRDQIKINRRNAKSTEKRNDLEAGKIAEGDAKAQAQSQYLGTLYTGPNDKSIVKKDVRIGDRVITTYVPKTGSKGGTQILKDYARFKLTTNPQTATALASATTSAESALVRAERNLREDQAKWEGKPGRTKRARMNAKIHKKLQKEGSPLKAKQPDGMSDEAYLEALVTAEMRKTYPTYNEYFTAKSGLKDMRRRVEALKKMSEGLLLGAGGGSRVPRKKLKEFDKK